MANFDALCCAEVEKTALSRWLPLGRQKPFAAVSVA